MLAVKEVEDARERTVRPETEREVAEADESTVCPPTVNPPVVEALVSVVCPVTESVVADALPNVEAPLENVVNDGLGDTAMVEVEEKMMLAPAVKYETGVL